MNPSTVKDLTEVDDSEIEHDEALEEEGVVMAVPEEKKVTRTRNSRSKAKTSSSKKTINQTARKPAKKNDSQTEKKKSGPEARQPTIKAASNRHKKYLESYNEYMDVFFDLDHLERRYALVKKRGFWDLYEQTEIPGLADIVYPISEEDRQAIDKIVEESLYLTPEQKYYMSEKDFWLYRIRVKLGLNQSHFAQYLEEHGIENADAWLGNWERGAKDNNLAPHQYFRLPTSIAGSPERMIATARILHVDITDLLIVCGYPIRREKDTEKVVTEALEKQAKEHQRELERVKRETAEERDKLVKEEQEKLVKSELRAEGTIKQLELIYNYIQQKPDMDPKLKNAMEMLFSLYE
jgi:hypothetical protein